MPDELVKRGYLTQSLGNAVHSGEHSFQNVPGLLRHVLEIRAWERRVIVETGEEFPGFSNFEKYVEAHPPKGLGSTMGTLKSLVGHDLEARNLLDQILQRPVGTNQHTQGGLIQSTLKEEKRDRSDQLIRRLRKDFPELHDQVLRGEKTVYAASVEAKIYPARIAVNLKDPKSAASTLITWGSPEFLEELRRLLSQ